MRRPRFPTALVLLAGTVVCGCGDGEERLLATGSSTVAPILERAARQIESVHPDLRIDVQTGGSTRGIVEARDGSNHIGMSSRDLTPDEAEGLEVTPIAYDGIALIVHADNPLTGLDREQVRRLFTKHARAWSDLGIALDGPVHVVNKAEGRATLEVFLEYFGLDNREVEADAVIGDNAQGVRLVAGDPQAIGYVSIGEALTAIDRGVGIKALPLDGVAPTLGNVANGSYGVRRTLYLLFRAGSIDEGSQLLEYLRSDAGREIIESLSFVPVAAS